jgi:hypothetical protein
MPRKTAAQDPLFLEESLSGIDNGRVLQIEAWSGLGSVEDYPRFQRGLCLAGRLPVQIAIQGG